MFLDFSDSVSILSHCDIKCPVDDLEGENVVICSIGAGTLSMDTSTLASSTLPLYDAATSTIESSSRGTFIFMFNV